MKLTNRVRHAIDDLTNEMLRRLVQEVRGAPHGSLPGSLCATLLEIDAEHRALEGPNSKATNDRLRASSTLEQVLKALPPDEGDALFLHLGKGMTCAEIARQTGVPSGVVLNDLVRAYSHIRTLLGDL